MVSRSGSGLGRSSPESKWSQKMLEHNKAAYIHDEDPAVGAGVADSLVIGEPFLGIKL